MRFAPLLLPLSLALAVSTVAVDAQDTAPANALFQERRQKVNEAREDLLERWRLRRRRNGRGCDADEVDPIVRDDPRFDGCGNFDMQHRFDEDGDGNFLDVLKRSVDLAVLVYSTDSKIKREYPDAVITNYPGRFDKTVVVRRGDICFGVFRGTNPANPVDILQNLDPRRTTLCGSRDGSACCEVREGFAETADAPGMEECKQGCPDCKVVMTGHSQGGAIATSAAIIFQHFQPSVFNFGEPGVILPESLVGDTPCKDIFRDADDRLPRIYRFINTKPKPSATGINYDPVGLLEGEPTSLTGLSSELYGQVFIVGVRTTRNIAHYRASDEFPEEFVRVNLDPTAHVPALYDRKIKALRRRVNASGFRNFRRCTYDSECISGSCTLGACSRN